MDRCKISSNNSELSMPALSGARQSWRVLHRNRAPSSNNPSETDIEPLSISYPLVDELHFEDIRDVPKRIKIDYAQFNIMEPHFISVKDRDLFYLNENNKKAIGIATKDKLRGEIVVVRNGTHGTPYDCGYRGKVNSVMSGIGEHTGNNNFFALAPLVVPDSYSFQHFIDGLLPKIIQAYDVIKIPSVKILVERFRDSIVLEILERLNITGNKLVYYEKGEIYQAEHLVFACVAPPLHPLLWQHARNKMGVIDNAVEALPDNVVLVTRKEGVQMNGRHILNRDAVVNVLRERYGNRLIVLHRGIHNLGQAIEFHKNVKIIIGVHGGALYNSIFMPTRSYVVEITPTLKTGQSVEGIAERIFWYQSNMIGQNYWRIPVQPQNQWGDVEINIPDLLTVLDKIEDLPRSES
ncbi:uncharacterized protein LOC144344177 [Saccoglossus kowalevskii]